MDRFWPATWPSAASLMAQRSLGHSASGLIDSTCFCNQEMTKEWKPDPFPHTQRIEIRILRLCGLSYLLIFLLIKELTVLRRINGCLCSNSKYNPFELCTHVFPGWTWPFEQEQTHSPILHPLSLPPFYFLLEQSSGEVIMCGALRTLPDVLREARRPFSLAEIWALYLISFVMRCTEPIKDRKHREREREKGGGGEEGAFVCFPQSLSLCHFAPFIDGLVDTLNCRYLILCWPALCVWTWAKKARNWRHQSCLISTGRKHGAEINILSSVLSAEGFDEFKMNSRLDF